MFSHSAADALNQFLSVVHDRPNQSIAFRRQVEQAGPALQFSGSAPGGEAGHLVLCARSNQGLPELDGLFFEGDPFTVARQAENWLKDACVPRKGPEHVSTAGQPAGDWTRSMFNPSAASALSGFLSAIGADAPEVQFIASRQSPEGHGPALHFRAVSAGSQRVADLVIFASLVGGVPRLEGRCFKGAGAEEFLDADKWLATSFEISDHQLSSDRVVPEFPWEQESSWVKIKDKSRGVLFDGTDLASTREYLEGLESLLSALRERGFKSVYQSRIGDYHRALTAFSKNRSDATLGPALQACYEARQLIPIVHSLANELSDDQIAQLISGRFSPEREWGTPAAKGRNFQFELYVAAICKRAGFRVALANPDVVVEWEQGKLNLAVKRVQSFAAVEKRCREGSNQISREGVSGIVVVDLSPIYNPEHNLLRLYSSQRASEILGSRVEGLLQSKSKALRSFAGKHTCAYLFHASVPVIWIGHEMGSFVTFAGLGVRDSNHPEARMARHFVQQFGGALTN